MKNDPLLTLFFKQSGFGAEQVHIFALELSRCLRFLHHDRQISINPFVLLEHFACGGLGKGSIGWQVMASIFLAGTLDMARFVDSDFRTEHGTRLLGLSTGECSVKCGNRFYW